MERQRRPLRCFRGSSGWIVLLLALALRLTGAPSGQETRPALGLEPVEAAVVEAGPRATVTVAFRVFNRGPKTVDVTAGAALPEGWSLLTEETPFSLEAGEETIRLVAFLVPARAAADIYRVTYSVRTTGTSGPVQSAAAAVRVPFQPRLVLRVLDKPTMVIAGETYQVRFLLVNEGNGPLSAALDIRRSGGEDYSPRSGRWDLGVGESRAVLVSLKTPSGAKAGLMDRLQATAAAASPGGTVRAEALSQVEVLAPPGLEVNGHHRLPVELEFLGTYSNIYGVEPQIGLSGHGSFDDRGRHLIDFVFRGLKSQSITQLLPWENEARLGYRSGRNELNLGDRIFTLTRLTEYGRYRRGLDGSLGFGPFDLRAFFLTDPLLKFEERQAGFQLGFRPAPPAAFMLGYIANRFFRADGAGVLNPLETEMLSLRTQVSAFPKILELNLEYALGRSKDAGEPAGAYWLEASGAGRAFSYRLNSSRSPAAFPGSFSGLRFDTADFSIRPVKPFSLFGSYTFRRSDPGVESGFPASAEEFYRTGLSWDATRSTGLRFELRNREWKDDGPAPAYHFDERTYRVGASQRIGPLRLTASVDFGRTDNLLSGLSARMAEYMASLSLNAARWISFGGTVHYRDQEQSFTGDRFDRLSGEVHFRLTAGRSSLSAMYRTSFRREFEEEIAQGVSDIERILGHEYDLFDVQLKIGLWAGHTFGLRARGLSRPAGLGPDTDIIGLAEYIIPLGLPVSRRTDLGALRGRVMDTENGGAGVSGLILRANRAAAVTDDDGSFVFNGLAPGRVILSLDRDSIGRKLVSREPIPVEVEIEGGVTTARDIRVARAASIAGRVAVFEFADGIFPRRGTSPEQAVSEFVEDHGLSSVTVELEGEGRRIVQRTDGRGEFAFDDLFPGRWTLKVQGEVPPFSFFEKDVVLFDLAPGEDAETLIRVLPKARTVEMVDGGDLPLKTVQMKNGLPGPSRPAILKSLDVRKTQAAIEVDLVLDGPVSTRTFTLGGPDRIVVDLTPVRAIEVPRKLDVGDGGILRIRVGTLDESTARIVFDTDGGPSNVRCQETPTGLTIIVPRKR